MSSPGSWKLITLCSFVAATAWTAWLTDPVDARECKWFGTPPFCRGNCPAGWEYTGKRVPCTTGSMRYCCKPCGPRQYGTPGCPYPSFGGKEKPKPSSGEVRRGSHF